VSDVIVEHCTSSGNGYAVLQERGDSTWDNVEFRYNSPSGGVFVAWDTGAARSGSVHMTHASFHDNGGAFVFYVPFIELELTNSIFYANTSTTNNSPFDFTASGYGPQAVWNNSFYGNTDSATGYPMKIEGGVDFQNNIVQASSGTVEVVEPGSVNYNDFYGLSIQTMGSGTSTGNISQNPFFNDAGHGDLTLDSGFSACVDAGNPLAGYDDPDGSRNDMGAYGGPSGGW
jgi:hypothetical protein